MVRRTAFDAFNDEFEKNLSGRSITEAFQLAEKNFEDQHGFRVYSDQDSFRQVRNRKLKTKNKR